MREHEVAFLVCVGCVSLDRAAERVVLEQLPVLSVFQRGLDEDALINRVEVLSTDDLTNEINLWDVVTFLQVNGFASERPLLLKPFFRIFVHLRLFVL